MQSMQTMVTWFKEYVCEYFPRSLQLVTMNYGLDWTTGNFHEVKSTQCAFLKVTTHVAVVKETKWKSMMAHEECQIDLDKLRS